MGVICAAPIYNGWYRAQVIESQLFCFPAALDHCSLPGSLVNRRAVP